MKYPLHEKWFGLPREERLRIASEVLVNNIISTLDTDQSAEEIAIKVQTDLFTAVGIDYEAFIAEEEQMRNDPQALDDSRWVATLLTWKTPLSDTEYKMEEIVKLNTAFGGYLGDQQIISCYMGLQWHYEVSYKGRTRSGVTSNPMLAGANAIIMLGEMALEYANNT